MPKVDGSNWSLRYPSDQSNARALIALPADMVRDWRVLSTFLGLSMSEFVRRSLTREIAEFLIENPQAAPSLRGRLLEDAHVGLSAPASSPPEGEGAGVVPGRVLDDVLDAPETS